MTRGGEPWSLLGIAPTHDAREIRRAYAARLRETRPDEDAAGFQRLVEARDRALRCGAERVLGTLDVPAGSAETVDVEIATPAVPRVDVMTEFFNSLEAIPHRTYPEHVIGPWQEVISAIDDVPLDRLPSVRAAVLNRLMLALEEDLGPMPGPEILPEIALKNERLVGPYHKVLGDIDRRFELRQQDAFLLNVLDPKRAWYLFTMLELAGQDVNVSSGHGKSTGEVRAVDVFWAMIAFTDDAKMLRFYRKAVAADRYPPSFSIIGALFALPVALYYRLYGLAIAITAIMVWVVAGYVSWRLGGSEHYVFGLMAYFFISYVVAVHLPAMRMRALEGKLTSLAGSKDLPSIAEGLRRWGKPNVPLALSGVAFNIVAVLVLAMA